MNEFELAEKKSAIIFNCCIKCMNEDLKHSDILAMACKSCGRGWKKIEKDEKPAWITSGLSMSILDDILIL